MHVALALAGTGDLHELRPRAHVLHGGTADVAHRRAQAAGELVDHAAERAAVRHAAFDAFGHELVGVAALLAVAILGPLFHRRQPPHAALAHIAAALEDPGLAGRFLGSGDTAAGHPPRRPGPKRLSDLPPNTAPRLE